MLFSSLRMADWPSWHSDHNFSRKVAGALSRAYTLINWKARAEGRFLEAYALVLPIINEKMSLQQRLHVIYLHALAYMEGGDTTLAIGCLDTAEDYASILGEFGALADIHALRGRAYHYASQFYRALDDFADCLDFAQYSEPDHDDADPEFVFDVMSSLASFELLTANFAEAAETADVADYMVTHAPSPELFPEAALGNLLLVRAHVWRLGAAPNLKRARDLAAGAVKIYRQAHARESLIRAQTLTADITLDIAEGLAATPTSSTFARRLNSARKPIEQALSLAKEIGDVGGLGLAHLSQARFLLLSGANVNTRAQIESVMGRALHSGDPGLYAQALTALSHDYYGRGEHESALSIYRSVISRLRNSQIPMLEIIPRNALLREFHA